MPTKEKQERTKGNSGGYERFLRDIKLVGLNLRRSQSRIDHAKYFDLVLNSKKRAVISISATYELEKVRGKSFDATANLKLTVQEPKGNVNPLAIECVFETHFYSSSDVGKDLAERFTDSDVRVVVWPYFRQFVSDMTARMGIPPLTVPLSSEK